MLDIEQYETISGLFANPQVISPLHAEFHTLLWAMRETLRSGFTSLRFESDCLQLVKLIEEEEDWPAMASELDDFFRTRDLFLNFSFVFIPRTTAITVGVL